MSDKEKIEELLRVGKEFLKIMNKSKIKELPEIKQKLSEIKMEIAILRGCLLEMEENENE